MFASNIIRVGICGLLLALCTFLLPGLPNVLENVLRTWQRLTTLADCSGLGFCIFELVSTSLSADKCRRRRTPFS
jgi:hypothetical protein